MLENREGKRVPDAVFKTRDGADWRERTSAEIFGGKTVVVFSLPGAFTPTCSSAHVPRYDDLVPTLKQQGVDEVVCISVNDAFVMDAWKDQQHADNILFLPDGSGHFTRDMGLLVDRDDLGFGPRSWRYSMLVRDGVIEKMFIEPEEAGDPFHVSDADTMLRYLSPEIEAPLEVAIMTRPGCSHCARAKQQLSSRGIAFAELELEKNFPQRALRAMSGRDTFPQVFINGVAIGGADDLEQWFEERNAA